MSRLLAIDPGAQGGMAWRDSAGIVRAQPMPEGMTAQIDAIRALRATDHIEEAIMENVGGYMPGNAGPGAVTFARHIGNLEGALYALGVPMRKPVAPQTWQKHYGFSVTRHLPPSYKAMEDGKDKKRVRDQAAREHKREIREQMQRACPHLSVTLNTADALAILGYAEAAQDRDSRGVYVMKQEAANATRGNPDADGLNASSDYPDV